MRIHIASDHAGYELKSAVSAHLREQGHTVIDQIVLNAVRKFKFDPALDTNGNPMKTKRLLKFPFDGSAPHPFDDDENKRTRANRELFLREKQQRENAPPA